MLTVEELLLLKNRLNKELQRRNQSWGNNNTGQMNHLSGAEYAFTSTDTPTHGNAVKADTGKKLSIYFLKSVITGI